MQYPPEVTEAVRNSVIEHWSDIDATCREALAALKRLPDYGGLVERLVEDAVRGLVYQERHAVKVAAGRKEGKYGGAAKVSGAGGAAVLDVYKGWYAHTVADRALGSLLGDELEALARQEETAASERTFNARLLRRLRPLVRGDRTVLECVREERLALIVLELREEMGPRPAEAGD